MNSNLGEGMLKASRVLKRIQADYLHAMKVGSGREADKVVEHALGLGVTVNAIYLDVFQPTAYEIGRLWQYNEFTVAQEHLATAIIERQMGEPHPLFRPKLAKPKKLVIGCVDQELHRVGARMVTDFFEQDGWTVDYLGERAPGRPDRPVIADGLSRGDHQRLCPRDGPAGVGGDHGDGGWPAVRRTTGALQISWRSLYRPKRTRGRANCE